MQILNKVAADHPNVAKLICWCNSCVPQNRNSHILQAILENLSKQSKITVVTMKHSLGRYSCVQEVDKMHQEIEVAMRVTEFYSPLSFLRILLKVNRNCPYSRHSNEKWRLQGLSEFFEDATIQAKINDLKPMLIPLDTAHWQAIPRLYWRNWTMKFLLPNDKR